MSRTFFCCGIVALALLAGYFFDRLLTPNLMARLLPVITMVDSGTSRIDPYSNLAQDKSFIDGHYYSDKAPLSSWVAVPFYFIYQKVASPLDPDTKILSAFAIGNVLTGILPLIFLVSAIFWKLGVVRRSRNAIALSVLPVFSTYLVIYAGSYSGHLLSGAFLLAAWLLLREGRAKPGVCAIAGILAGLAFMTEYPVAILAAFLSFHVLWTSRSLRHFAAFCAGFAPAVAIILVYNYCLTGSIFKFTYQFVVEPEFQHMKTSYGFGFPTWQALVGLSFGLKRGFFVFAPLMIYIAALALSRPRVFLRFPALLAGCAAFYLLIAGYKMWWGGWAYGPRHLIPMAFLLIYEGVLFLDTRNFSKPIMVALSLVGILFAWMANSTCLYMIPDQFENPLFDFILPKLLKNQTNPNNLLTTHFSANATLGCLLWLPLAATLFVVFHLWYLKERAALNAPANRTP